MLRSSTSTRAGKATRGRSVTPSRWKGPGVRRGLALIGVIALAIAVLGIIFARNSAEVAGSDTQLAGKYPFQVGDPGPGKEAPAIRLPSTAGGTFDLAALRGKTVLLYFQEGLMCQPCWDQIKSIESEFSEFQALGIDQVVSITTNELDQLKRKVADEGISTPVLSDPDLAVSKAYTANLYGMMGTNFNGHTFIVVGPDGKIRWRADYGGEPKYTMYVRTPNLLADLRQGLDGATEAK